MNDRARHGSVLREKKHASKHASTQAKQAKQSRWSHLLLCTERQLQSQQAVVGVCHLLDQLLMVSFQGLHLLGVARAGLGQGRLQSRLSAAKGGCGARQQRIRVWDKMTHNTRDVEQATAQLRRCAPMRLHRMPVHACFTPN